MRTILIAVTCILFFINGKAAGLATPTPITTIPTVKPAELRKLSIKKIEQLTGHKLNFIERTVCRLFMKKMQQAISVEDADRMAKRSEIFGIIAIVAFFIFPLLTIPFGIMAITSGSKALASKTTIPRKAKTGRILGIVGLSLFILALLLILFIIALYTSL